MKKQNYIYTENGNYVTLRDKRTNASYTGELYTGKNGKTYVKSMNTVSMTLIAKYRKNFAK